MPEVQVARVENLDAGIGDQKGNALVRRAERLDVDRAEAPFLARVHAHAAVRLRHVKADDVYGVLAAQIVHRFRKMIAVAVADEHVELFKIGKRALFRQDALVRTMLAGIKEQSSFANGYKKTAASQVINRDILHHQARSFLSEWFLIFTPSFYPFFSCCQSIPVVFLHLYTIYIIKMSKFRENKTTFYRKQVDLRL